MAVSNKFSCSCRKSPKQKPVLSEGFVNYLQIVSHHYRELMNLKLREYNCLSASRKDWPEDVGILASTHKPEDTRMWECEKTKKRIWTGDIRILENQEAHMNWGYKDVRMQVYKQAHLNLRMWGCRDKTKGILTWRYDDVKMRGYKQVYTKIRIWECEDGYKQVHRNLRMRGCEDINKSNISNIQVTFTLHASLYA